MPQRAGPNSKPQTAQSVRSRHTNVPGVIAFSPAGDCFASSAINLHNNLLKQCAVGRPPPQHTLPAPAPKPPPPPPAPLSPIFVCLPTCQPPPPHPLAPCRFSPKATALANPSSPVSVYERCLPPAYLSTSDSDAVHALSAGHCGIPTNSLSSKEAGPHFRSLTDWVYAWR